MNNEQLVIFIMMFKSQLERAIDNIETDLNVVGNNYRVEVPPTDLARSLGATGTATYPILNDIYDLNNMMSEMIDVLTGTKTRRN